MAEAVVSVALETFRDLLEEARFLSGVGGEVKALQTQLREMKCLLEDADRRQHESKSVANWIAEIRDLAYRAEDAIETYAVKVPSKRGRGLKELLRRFSCIMNEFHSLHQIGSEISQIKSDLAAVGQSMRDYGIKSIIEGETSTASENQQWKRQTFPHFKIGDCFVGKDDELKRIVSLLVNEEHQHHRVVSIWGMGGLGKTTIARKAYNHEEAKRFFQAFAWVCISQQCNIQSVLQDVLKQLNPLKKDVIPSMSITELIEELCQIQKAKPCIIVLDDLWKTDHWDGLKHVFLIEGLKSKIMVTTRNEKVAEVGFPLRLGLLSMDSGWELLKMKAFPGTNIPDFACDENLLREIGEEMIRKCGFLPLTISLLGGVLSKRKSMNHWMLVRENINTYLFRSAENKEVDAVLNSSYQDLPYYLKPCFLYLSLFEEDELIRAIDIYQLWIAHGMISRGNREDESLDDIAELYLRELASRSIVEFEEYDEDSKFEKINSAFKLHDVVRELCLLIAERRGFGVQKLYNQGGNSLRDSLSGVKTRHLAIRFNEENVAILARREFAISGVEDTCTNVRSLLLDTRFIYIDFEKIGIDLQIFKLLRVLHFYWLRRIGNLIHLRYLRFEECKLDEVPSSIGNLRYLQTLDLSSSENVRVPNVWNKLLRLKHLMLPSYYSRTVGGYAFKLDEGLDELETLEGFNSLIHKIKSITRLKNLRQFGANVWDNESLSEVMDALNREWNKLQYWRIEIRKGCELTSTDEGLEILKKVLTCPRLHNLGIRAQLGKQLNKCGNCVSSSSIVDLHLVFCEIEENPMEILGKLPELRRLYFYDFSFVGEEMVCPAFSFPRLKKLDLQMLPHLREWRVEEGAMPLLSQLIISSCPKLMMLPDGLRFISSLKKLTIQEMPHLAKRVLVSENDGGEGGEDFDKVRHVPSIIIHN